VTAFPLLLQISFQRDGIKFVPLAYASQIYVRNGD
jgi:hypothetical protein